MRVLMVGVDRQTKGGMWTVAENYLNSEAFVRETNLEYVSTSVTGSIPKRLLFTAKALLKIAFRLAKNRYDIVHIHMAERGSVYRKNIVINLAKLRRCKVVIHMHGAEFETWYKSLSAGKQRGVRKILSKGDRILILGAYWLEFVQGLVSDQSSVCVLHNAVSVPRENPYNPEAVNMLFLGVVGKRKGIFDLLEAVKLADSRLPEHAKLIIYGPESDCSIEKTIAKQKLTGRVEYRGWLSGEDRAAVFGETAVNILPSYHEGLPMTILETMAYGIPNISTDVAAIPEAVSGENGAVIRPGDVEALADAISRLMNDAEDRKRKSRLAYEKARADFSIENHVSRVLDLYRSLE